METRTMAGVATTGRVLLALAAIALIVFAMAAPVAASGNTKWFVCKYVGKPGVDETLQGGGNPISVSENAIKISPVVPGASFADAQGRSVVLVQDTGQAEPDPSECPAAITPETPPGEGGGEGGSEGNHASLNIKKTDEGGHGLAGAVFTVEGMQGTFTSADNGKFCITGLPNDSLWLVTEIQAPAGYQLADPASQMVEVDDDGDCNSASAKFVNVLATATPTPEGSVAGGTSTPSPSPEESVKGGTGTPEPSQPDTAMGAGGGPSPIPTIAFGMILLSALGTLAWANVKSARSRA